MPVHRLISNFISAALLIPVLLFNSCKKDKPGEVVFEYTQPFLDNMEIDVSNVDSLVVRETFDFPTALDGELAKNNTSKAKIKSAKLVFLRLQVWDYAFDDTTKYSNLKDISELRMDIKNNFEGQRPVAFKYIPDNRVKAINMDLHDQELRDYLKRDQFRMVIKYRKRRAMPHEMPFIISATFRIVADPL